MQFKRELIYVLSGGERSGPLAFPLLATPLYATYAKQQTRRKNGYCFYRCLLAVASPAYFSWVTCVTASTREGGGVSFVGCKRGLRVRNAGSRSLRLCSHGTSTTQSKYRSIDLRREWMSDYRPASAIQFSSHPLPDALARSAVSTDPRKTPPPEDLNSVKKVSPCHNEVLPPRRL